MKLSIRKAFVGRRKMKSRQRERAVVIEESMVTTTSVHIPRSTSETKSNAFGISMEEMLRQSEAPVCQFEDCYLFVQKSIMLDFLVPYCAQCVSHLV